MRPAVSLILFTTLSGVAQGLATLLALAVLAGAAPPPPQRALLVGLALGLLAAGLVASFFHLGRPRRAWQAARQWRTSWMSREVIVLPLLMALLGTWWLGLVLPERPAAAPAAAAALALAVLVASAGLWWCTGMIYACLRFVQAWAHPLTLAVFALSGLSAGAVLAAALAAAGLWSGPAAPVLAPAAAALTALACGVRLVSWWRIARLRPRSTLQSATGLAGAPLRQWSMGFTGRSFNTREFQHGASRRTLHTRVGLALGLGYALPLLLMATGPGAALAALAVALQTVGLWADRWLFFAQAQHPQNLYYQAVA